MGPAGSLIGDPDAFSRTLLRLVSEMDRSKVSGRRSVRSSRKGLRLLWRTIGENDPEACRSIRDLELDSSWVPLRLKRQLK
jgi:hypothetical protein